MSVIVGSPGRIPVGALTDRYGARLMFPLVSAFTIVPVLLLIPARHSYAAMLGVGFLLGLGGTPFAIGVPLVNSWFPPARRGFALAALAVPGALLIEDRPDRPVPIASLASRLGSAGKLRVTWELSALSALSALYAIGFGGLGGFVPPLVMGAVYSAKDSYAIGFMPLSGLALAGCVYAFGRMRGARRE